MVISPNNEIVLLKVPLEIDNKNQLTFNNANDQFTYFRNQIFNRSYDKITYVRKDGYVVVNDCFDNLIQYNYCMYQNENFSTKWYYAFIVKIEWLSPNSTKVYIKTDVWQTYQFDINFKDSFIEREHVGVSNDLPGANLVEEGLETGEYIENASTSINGLGICYVIAYARDPSDIGGGTSIYNGCLVNGIASGLWYYIGSMNAILTKLKDIDNAGYGDDVKAVYSIPTVAILGWDSEYSIEELDDRYQVWGFWVNNQFYSDGRDFTLNSTPSSLNGYEPRNQKLRQFPYCYLGFTPTNGEQAIFRYENFTSGTPSFKLISEINPNPSIYFIPKNYKGKTGVNVSESVIVNGYPSIAYKTDFFSNWIAQNSSIVNFNKSRTESEYQLSLGKGAINYMSGTVAGSLGLVSGQTMGGGGFIGSSANFLYDSWAGRQKTDLAIEEQMLQVEKQKMLPNTGNVGGSNATLLGYDYMNSDVFTRYSIKRQFAERIDQFFDMYGYKILKVKIPNINNRPNWNYIKTIGVNIEAKLTHAVPQEDISELKSFFDNGITLWHNPNTFLDYSQNNR